MRPISLRNIFPKTLLLLSLLANSPIVSAKEGCDGSDDFDAWKKCFLEKHFKQNASSKAHEMLSHAKLNDTVIKLDKKQPEKKFTFDQYLKIIDIDEKIKEGRKFLSENRNILGEISQKYNVPAEVIVALVGIESHYGTNMGKFNIIDSLSTLAYDGRRSKLFENELLKAIAMAQQNKLSYDDFIGSWAGAMGQCQFMPSSYQAYAVDYDGDGTKDIWKSKQDVFASVANYLRSNNWIYGLGKVGKYEGKFENNAKKIEEVSKNCDIVKRPCEIGDSKFLISLDGNDIMSSTYKVDENFKVLLKWNRSYFFSLSVLMMAERIGKSN